MADKDFEKIAAILEQVLQTIDKLIERIERLEESAQNHYACCYHGDE